MISNISEEIHIDKQIRWKEHVREFQKGIHYNDYFQRAWDKYGRKNFEYKIIEYCKKEELGEREIYYIKEFKTKSPNGYNLTDGGEGLLNPSEETRKKISDANIGENNFWFGKHRSKKEKKKISDIQTGRILLKRQSKECL